MSGCLILTVSPGALLGPVDEAGRLVALAVAREGVPIASRQVVDEDEPAVEAALRQGLEGHRLTVVLNATGGSAGETVRRVLARLTGTRLVLNEGLLAAFEKARARRGQAMPRRLDRLALLPQGATLWSVDDDQVSWLLETAHGAVAVLPQASAALSVVVTRNLVPFARERFAGREVVLLRTLRVVGVAPGDAEARLGNWLRPESPVGVSCLPMEGEVWVRLRARDSSLALAEAALGEVEAQVVEVLGADCYGRDQESLEVVVGRLLLERRLTLSVAESCTGGLLSHRITNVPGASAYFERGVVVYSNQAKEELLDVPRELLIAHGAVSGPVAEAMARGICRKTGTPLGLGVTGIAGPDGGTPAKPVGTVYVALATADGARARRFSFAGGREAIKWESTQVALDILRRRLLQLEERW
ncbi:MAG: nicotinamide-nucleotide amidohydrolase family protein [Candidatus Rokubacteria bacterium]|nr:nicotinamide-nucleotide amidohydrolase family protein [Candidatus Rokubacteria bacterium]